MWSRASETVPHEGGHHEWDDVDESNRRASSWYMSSVCLSVSPAFFVLLFITLSLSFSPLSSYLNLSLYVLTIVCQCIMFPSPSLRYTGSVCVNMLQLTDGDEVSLGNGCVNRAFDSPSDCDVVVLADDIERQTSEQPLLEDDVENDVISRTHM